MKTFLFTLAFIVLAGLLALKTDQYKELRLTSESLAEELTTSSALLKKKDKEYKSLLTNYETLKEELDRFHEEPVADTTTPAPTSVASTVTTPEAPASATTPAKDNLEERLATLKGIYDTAVADIADRRAKLKANRTNAQTQLDTLHRNPPQFQEQSARVNAFGSKIGNKGIRTSQADRDEALAIHNQEVTKWEQFLQAGRDAEKQLNIEATNLEDRYRDAIREARELAK
jgi:hypothetical protein